MLLHSPATGTPDGSTARPRPDLARAELAAADFLDALGIPLGSEHLRATPGRMARAWAEMLTPRIVGLSKLARVVEHFACRPQTQERLTKQIADWLDDNLAPRAVGVVVAAEHSCMTLRGAQATGSSTVTSTLLGWLREDPRARQEFLALAGVHRREGE